MAIGTMDQLVAGYIHYPVAVRKNAATATAAGIWHNTWYGAGTPGAGSAPTGALNGATFSSVAANPGALSIPGAVAGTVSYLVALRAVQGGNIGIIQIWDRLWGNVPVVTTTGAQAVVSPTWPARDASASTSGEQVFLALECSAATGNVGAITNTTVSYTNTAGTAGRTATLSSFPATAAAGTFVLLSAQAGDTGTRSVQSITLGTSYVSGAVHLVAVRLVAEIHLPTANVGNAQSWTGLGMPAVWDNSVLTAVVLPTATALSTWSGSLSYAQG